MNSSSSCAGGSRLQHLLVEQRVDVQVAAVGQQPALLAEPRALAHFGEPTARGGAQPTDYGAGLFGREHPIPAGVLRGVQRAVSRPEQAVDVGAVVGVGGDASSWP